MHSSLTPPLEALLQANLSFLPVDRPAHLDHTSIESLLATLPLPTPCTLTQSLLDHLSLQLHRLLIHSLDYFSLNIHKPTLHSLQDLLSVYVKTESALGVRTLDDDGIGAIRKYSDLTHGFYICIHSLLCTKELKAKIVSDDKLMLDLATVLCHHLFGGMASQTLEPAIGSVLADLKDSSVAFGYLITIGLPYFDKPTQKHNSKGSSKTAFTVLLNYLCDALLECDLNSPDSETKVPRIELIDSTISTRFFSLGTKESFSNVFDDNNKVKLLKTILSQLAKTPTLSNLCVWVELVAKYINARLSTFIPSENPANRIPPSKSKPIKQLFISFYSTLFSQKAKIPLSPKLNIVNVKPQPLSIPIFFDLSEEPLPKQSINYSTIITQNPPAANRPCLSAFVSCQSSSEENYTPRLQAIFIHSFQQNLDTALKLFVIFSNREENAQLRLAFFNIFLQNVQLLAPLFFSQPSNSLYLKLLNMRSNDSCPEIRTSAINLIAKLLQHPAADTTIAQAHPLFSLLTDRTTDSVTSVLSTLVPCLSTLIRSVPTLSAQSLTDTHLISILSLLQSSSTSNPILKPQIYNLAYSLFLSSTPASAVQTVDRSVKLGLSQPTLIHLLSKASKIWSSKHPQEQQAQFINLLFTAYNSNSPYYPYSLTLIYSLLAFCNESTPGVSGVCSNHLNMVFLENALQQISNLTLFAPMSTVIVTSISQHLLKLDQNPSPALTKLTNQLNKTLDLFWNQPPQTMKHLSRLLVAICQLLSLQDLLSALLMRSLNFLTTVKHLLPKSTSTSSQIPQPSTLPPLRVAFFSLYHLLSHIHSSLDQKVLHHLDSLSRQFLTLPDKETLQYALALLFTLHDRPTDRRRSRSRSKSKVQRRSSSNQRHDDIYTIMDGCLQEKNPAYLEAVLFVSDLILKKSVHGAAVLTTTTPLRRSRSSAALNMNQQEVDRQFFVLWRSHSASLFSLLDEPDQHPSEIILNALEVVRELSLQKELQLRQAFSTVFSLILDTDLDVRSRAVEILREIAAFECRLFRENLQFGILDKLVRKALDCPFTSQSIVDHLWDFEKLNSIEGPEGGYLSLYAQEQITKHGKVSLLPDSLVYPAQPTLGALRLVDFSIYFILFYSPEQNLSRLAAVLRVFSRTVEEVLLPLTDKDATLSPLQIRKALEALKLWHALVFCLECMHQEGESGHSPIDRSLFNLSLSDLLTHLSQDKQQKKARKSQSDIEVTLVYRLVRPLLSEWDSLNSIILSNPDLETVWEDLSRIRDSLSLTCNEIMADKEATGKPRPPKDRPGKAKKNKKKKRRRTSDDGSPSEGWDSDEDDEEYAEERPIRNKKRDHPHPQPSGRGKSTNREPPRVKPKMAVEEGNIKTRLRSARSKR